MKYKKFKNQWQKVGSLGNDNGDGNESGKKAIGLDKQINDNFARASRFFCTFLCRHYDYDVKVPNFTFVAGDGNTRQRLSFSFLNFDTVFQNSCPEKFASI